MELITNTDKVLGSDAPDGAVVSDSALLRITAFAGRSGLRFFGDIDSCTIGEVAEAVDAAVRHGNREIYLDLATVDFCGLEGLRLFAEAARRLGEEGRELVLCSVAPHLVRVLRLVGWDKVPGLFIVARHPSSSAPRWDRAAGDRPVAPLGRARDTSVGGVLRTA
ncbi:anti-anti-sigma factor [Actinocorallia herbida]|uniref:Anti-anti-sigma factor n=1 Tax=Actinocorallia herbida TaxID=58109 RepID=A0A3N1CW71_9ACTN|nr:STAS domain-containing protein [Actinocorallia herbida]ROO85536.1 anti-anti-sigma factor [Actinocorallia herbida]